MVVSDIGSSGSPGASLGGELGSCASATTLTEDIVVSSVGGTMESGFGTAPPDQSPDKSRCVPASNVISHVKIYVVDLVNVYQNIISMI